MTRSTPLLAILAVVALLGSSACATEDAVDDKGIFDNWCRWSWCGHEEVVEEEVAPIFGPWEANAIVDFGEDDELRYLAEYSPDLNALKRAGIVGESLSGSAFFTPAYHVLNVADTESLEALRLRLREMDEEMLFTVQLRTGIELDRVSVLNEARAMCDGDLPEYWTSQDERHHINRANLESLCRYWTHTDQTEYAPAMVEVISSIRTPYGDDPWLLEELARDRHGDEIELDEDDPDYFESLRQLLREDLFLLDEIRRALADLGELSLAAAKALVLENDVTRTFWYISIASEMTNSIVESIVNEVGEDLLWTDEYDGNEPDPEGLSREVHQYIEETFVPEVGREIDAMLVWYDMELSGDWLPSAEELEAIYARGYDMNPELDDRTFGSVIRQAVVASMEAVLAVRVEVEDDSDALEEVAEEAAREIIGSQFRYDLGLDVGRTVAPRWQDRAEPGSWIERSEGWIELAGEQEETDGDWSE